MANHLKNIVQFTGLVIGVPTPLPHNLNVDGVSVQPDKYYASDPGFTIVVTTTTVTATRTAFATTASVDVLVEYWHTIDRVFGPFGTSQPGALVGSPFTMPPGISGGGFDPARTITVAQSGGTATTITGGLAAAAALVPTPSVANPVLILIFPGVYPEAPLVVPEGVTLDGHSVSSTIIVATTATSSLLTLQAGGQIQNFTLSGADGVGGSGLLVNDAGNAVANRIRVIDCTTGIQVVGAGVNLLTAQLTLLRIPGQTLTTGLEILAGAKVIAATIAILGVGAAHIATGIIADGAAAVGEIYTITLDYCDDGLNVINGGLLSVDSGHVSNAVNALYVQAGGTNSTLEVSSIHVHTSTTYDIFVNSATGVLRMTACEVRSDKAFGQPDSNILSFTVSDEPGDEGHHFIGNLGVGSELFPSRAGFGGGASTNRSMAVFNNTNGEAGTWTDHTADAKSQSGSAFAAFPGVGADNCIYFGGLFKHVNLRLNTTIAIVLGAGALVWEFWDGGAWTALNVMASDHNHPHGQYAQDVFGRVAVENVRYSAFQAAWAMKSLNGSVALYWVRCRITVAITTSPTLEQVKLGTSRTKFDTCGMIEVFGEAAKQKQIPWHQRWTDNLQGAGPTNGALNFTAAITITPIDNQFADGALDGFGAIFTVPIGLDTSRDIMLRWSWIAQANGTAPNDQVEFENDWAIVQIGGTLNGTIADTHLAQQETVGVADDDVLKETSILIHSHDAVPGDKIAFSIFRDAQGPNLDDTFPAAIRIVDVEMFSYFWR